VGSILAKSRANYTQTQILRFRTEEELKSDSPDDLTCRKGPKVCLDRRRGRENGFHEEGCVQKLSRSMDEACKT
jgi:hypothetical protein